MIDALKKITSPSVANAIETFKVRPRHHGNVSSEIRCLFPELGPMVGYAVPCVIRAEHEVARLGPGDFFGEVALISGEPRNATVVAVTEVDTYVLGKTDFQTAIATSQSFRDQLYRVYFMRH